MTILLSHYLIARVSISSLADSQSSGGLVVAVSIIAFLAVSAAVFLAVIYRRRVQANKWLSTQQVCV